MRPLAALAVLLLVTACQAPPDEMTEAEIAQIEGEFNALDDALNSAVVNWDLDTLLGLFSADMSWALFGEVHHGLDSWIEHVTPAFSQGAGPLDRCEIINPRRQILARDVVISTAVVNCFAPSPDGPVLVIDHTWTAVWANENGEWKIVNVSETYRPSEPEG